MNHTVPVHHRHTPSRLLVALASALLASALLASSACSSSDGRELPPADAASTTTPVGSPAVGQPDDGDRLVEVFSLTSPAFAEGTAIPTRHTCSGEDLSPPLVWASTPPAAELAIVVRDQDAAGFVHWVVTGIDPLVQGIGEDGLPETAVEAANSTGTIGWSGPCPPAGSGTHTYVFSLHALPEPLGLAAGTPAEEAAQLVEGAASESAVLTGTVTAG